MLRQAQHDEQRTVTYMYSQAQHEERLTVTLSLSKGSITYLFLLMLTSLVH